MLKITIEAEEFFNEETSNFFTAPGAQLELEHSLVSLSKWEAIHQKPFLSGGEKTPEELLSYVMLMVLDEYVDTSVLQRAGPKVMTDIQQYIDSTQSATTFGNLPKSPSTGETITSELIYYWMVAFNIPFVCETWHLNRLFALIRICNIKNSKPQKISKQEQAQQYRDLNAARRAKTGSKG